AEAVAVTGNLLQIGSKEAAAILLAQLRDPEPWWRRAIAAPTQGLGQSVHESMLPVLEAMLSDADPEGAVPVLAMDATVRHLPIDVFARALTSERADVRQSAWSALPRHPVFANAYEPTEASTRVLETVLPLAEQELASGDPSRMRVFFFFL